MPCCSSRREDERYVAHVLPLPSGARRELRVLLGIVEVCGGVPETAAALGISAATVRTHLLRLYTKTGIRRQAELVKLAAGFASPPAEQGDD